MKRCCTCKLIKTDEAFNICRSEPDGLARRCRECRAAYYQANAEKVKARVRANRERDPEQKQQRDRQYYGRNQDRIKARVRRYYQANRDTKRAYAISYAQRHPEKMAIRRQAWYQANRDRARAAFQRRRARKRSAGGSFTAQEWRELCAQHGNRCLCCGSADADLTVDHVVPLVLGGRNDIENIQPLCLTCNLRKARKAIDYRGRARSCQS